MSKQLRRVGSEGIVLARGCAIGNVGEGSPNESCRHCGDSEQHGCRCNQLTAWFHGRVSYSSHTSACHNASTSSSWWSTYENTILKGSLNRGLRPCLHHLLHNLEIDSVNIMRRGQYDTFDKLVIQSWHHSAQSICTIRSNNLIYHNIHDRQWKHNKIEMEKIICCRENIHNMKVGSMAYTKEWVDFHTIHGALFKFKWCQKTQKGRSMNYGSKLPRPKKQV